MLGVSIVEKLFFYFFEAIFKWFLNKNSHYVEHLVTDFSFERAIPPKLQISSRKDKIQKQISPKKKTNKKKEHWQGHRNSCGQLQGPGY